MAKTNSFIILDFETGGLDPKINAITEVAAVAIKGDTLERIDLVSTYVKPYGSYTYEEEALKATGITHADIESGMEIKDVVGELLALFKKADLYPGKGALRPICVAHNSKFDKGFLIQPFFFCKKLKEFEKALYGGTDFYGNFQPEMIDTIPISRMAWGDDEDMTNYKLQSCITKAGIELNDAHRAINDTLATVDMFKFFINKLRATGDATGQESKTRFRKHFQF